MEKLLHERLQELAKNRDVELACENGVVYLFDDEAVQLVDEIERYYIPREQHEAAIKAERRCSDRPIKWFKRKIENGEDWPPPHEGEIFREYLDRCFVPRPRFEDGEPVQWGDEYQADSGKTVTLTQMFVRHTGKVVLGRQGKRAELPEGTFVKRPTPKVLDADGLPYKIDDEVWHIETGEAYRVIGLPSPNSYQTIQVEIIASGFKTGYDPNRLIHERPVFDANGERICKGDTVYVTEKYRNMCDKVGYEEEDRFFGLRGYAFGTPAVVTSIEHCAGYDRVYFLEEEGCNCPSDALTHRESDSLEKLRDDIRNSNHATNACAGIWEKRLTALIERGV